MKIKVFRLTVVFYLLICSQSVFSQKPLEKPFTASSDESGENASSFISGILVESERSNERIFIIFRAGTNEGKAISASRLSTTKQYFTNKKVNLKNFVFAQGEIVKGEGRIEFYLGSELKLVLLSKKNRMPNLTCCDV